MSSGILSTQLSQSHTLRFNEDDYEEVADVRVMQLDPSFVRLLSFIRQHIPRSVREQTNLGQGCQHGVSDRQKLLSLYAFAGQYAMLATLHITVLTDVCMWLHVCSRTVAAGTWHMAHGMGVTVGGMGV
jgi:hypothetical protein